MVESTALEMRRTGNRTVGSNPTLSAIIYLTTMCYAKQPDPGRFTEASGVRCLNARLYQLDFGVQETKSPAGSIALIWRSPVVRRVKG